MEANARAQVTAAVVCAALLAGCGAVSRPASGTSPAPAEHQTHSTRPAQLANPIVVRLPLTAAKRSALLAWMSEWRACMADHGVSLPPPQLFPRHISIDVEAVDGYVDPGAGGPPSPSAFMRTGMRCIEALGGPPATFLRTGGIVDLFKGTCAVQRSTKPEGQ
jgi:hypothetical protein